MNPYVFIAVVLGSVAVLFFSISLTLSANGDYREHRTALRLVSAVAFIFGIVFLGSSFFFDPEAWT